MPTLTICRGYPASGKTSWANGIVLHDHSVTRISRDDIRFNMLGIPQSQGVGTNAQEIQVSRIHNLLVNEMLASGRDVIVDDTNLPLKVARKWADAAQTVGAEFEVVDFEVDVDECLRRNKIRGATGGRKVPEEIIRNMAKKHPFPFLEVKPSDAVTFDYTYVRDTSLPSAYIFDVDGTLAQMDGRSPYDWSRVGQDCPKWDVIEVAKTLHAAGMRIVVMSGRDGACFDLTKRWLAKFDVPCDLLVMREQGDTRKDNIVKIELFRQHVAPFYNVLGTFDDRDVVVSMWRSIGLLCCQVNYGNF